MSEVKEPIQINDNKIKFKVWSFYGNPVDPGSPKLFEVFNKIKIAKTENMNLLIRLKRIREALQKEAEIVDNARKDILSEFALKDENGQVLMTNGNYVMPEAPEKLAELNTTYLEFLNQDIELPYDKIKSTQIVGIESLQELDILDGIIEIVEA
jgi:hypothetical protein